ncbi:MAG TPA: T9SS type A sorting domain-containing protein, partial [Bacteroidia bacterium]|nr:T9SS type A sorting domain-containing protein [Bacteroidia bacterium]
VNGLAPASTVQFLLNVNNGGYTYTDTITRVVGIPVVAFTDNCNSTTQWTGTWGISTVNFVSPTGSITDSPSGFYPTNANTKTTTVSNIDLTDALAAYLQFNARWEVERGYDYVEIQASTNGTTFTPLCGKYTHTGNSNQDNLQPLYDGIQDAWLKETINLSAYLGQNIKLRFNLVSDGGVDYDGLYFDDLSVQKITSTSNGINKIANLSTQVSLYPNPNNGGFVLNFNSTNSEKYKVTVSNVLGQEVYSTEQNNNGKSLQEINLNDACNGTYFVHIQGPGLNYVQKIMVNR